MDDVKLTLKLNPNSIKRAKKYSAQNKTSLSALVEKFFDGLTISQNSNEEMFNYSPIVSELSGIICVPSDYDYKAEYLDYLEDKYE